MGNNERTWEGISHESRAPIWGKKWTHKETVLVEKKRGDWIRTNHIAMHGKVTTKPNTYMPTTLLI